MKIMIMTDMEGVAGVLNHDDCPPYVRVDRFRKTDAFPPHVSEVKCDSGIIGLINMPPIRPK